nr:MAG TPA: hypothetical protein [Caudoviricetes sp.]
MEKCKVKYLSWSVLDLNGRSYAYEAHALTNYANAPETYNFKVSCQPVFVIKH